MSFGEAIRACFRGYAEFTGRARRSEFWWFFLFTVIVDGVTSNAFGEDLANAVSLVFVLPVLAAASRRLHDTDHSAWSLLLVLIPIVGWIVLTVWLASEGSETHNRFGPPA